VASLHSPSLTCTRNFHFPSFRMSRTTRYPDCYVSSLSSDGARQTQTWTFVVEERLQNYRNPQSLKLTRLKSSASRLERNPVPWFQCKEICLPINEAFPLPASTRSCIAGYPASLVGPAGRMLLKNLLLPITAPVSAWWASVISKDRCCPTLVFSLIPTASTQPLLIFCAVIAPFLPTFVMDSYCA